MGILDNKTYSWNTSNISFLPNFKMKAFGNGNYKHINDFKVEATFGGQVHLLTFNKNYTNFNSVRKSDNENVNGKLISINKPSNNNAPSLPKEDLAFITLTNNGYINYTLNCLKSLQKIKCKVPLHSFCVGQKGHKMLKNAGHSSQLVKNDNKDNSNFQTFENGGWANITYEKFDIIHKSLLKHKYVCFTDGDIVYENKDVHKYLLNNIKKNDMLIQSEGKSNNEANAELCTGFIFIKSNERTIALFNPVNVAKHKNKYGSKWNDQFYVNEFKHTVKYTLLPLELFPNGRYYYAHHSTISPYIIHFNFAIGDTKKEKMLSYGKWHI